VGWKQKESAGQNEEILQMVDEKDQL